jgi:hypothetical protein
MLHNGPASGLVFLLDIRSLVCVPRQAGLIKRLLVGDSIEKLPWIMLLT